MTVLSIKVFLHLLYLVSAGDLQMTLVLNYTDVWTSHGFRLFRSFHESTFLGRTPEVMACESEFRKWLLY